MDRKVICNSFVIGQVESCDSELRSLREPSFRTARQRALAGNDEDELEMLEFGRR